MASIQEISIRKYQNNQFIEKNDALAVEEPLEIQLHCYVDGEPVAQPISITMRTPGNDKELAVGFLFTEGILSKPSDLNKTLQLSENQIMIFLSKDATIDLDKLKRNFYTTSSCGVCGKSSIDAIRTISQDRLVSRDLNPKISHSVLLALKEKINSFQSNFEKTGGIHAAALFNLEGELESVYEDVGRHNALDKLIGAHVLKGEMDFSNSILLLSGRASFELIQKAIMADIRLICAIGAPSSLAVDLAKDFDISLIGFLKNTSFNVYHGDSRIE